MLHYNYPNDYSNQYIDPYYYGPDIYRNNHSSDPYTFTSIENDRKQDDKKSIIPTLPNSWSFGPLTIHWDFDGQSINMVLKVLEDALENVILSISKPTVTITTNIGNAAVNLRINADFTSKKIVLKGTICLDTVCTSFNNTTIAKWQ
ncbi:MAG: hypothetical protein GX895_06255 [Clostridiales bacterium]|uniref:hypothetical protein n=1 Tax=Clostridium sp. N3C TaxID=1776758 RepID=UPI00092E155B|nr:hypothetical protein [Clostridium sp. N3C]NLZ48378.1 hypothetical protein [Clostridiales bacterium]SCN24569.1 hypothetical protein N3C_1870 [Clostridium sp. N3C]